MERVEAEIELADKTHKKVKFVKLTEAGKDFDENAVEEKVECETNATSEDIVDVNAISQQIMSKPVSVKDKIKLFNTFAAGCYVSGDYQSAFDLLSGALTLDSSDPMIIKNLAYVCAAAGENEQAMEFVSKLPMVDFGILKTIK